VSSAFSGEVTQSAAVAEPFLFGDLADRLPGPPPAMAAAFVSRLDAALPSASLPATDMTVLVTKESATGRHLVVQQTMRGADVVGARFQLHVGEDQRPFGLTGRPIGDLPARDPGEPPRTSEVDATDAIRSHLQLPREVPIKVERVVSPIGGRGSGRSWDASRWTTR
jgi:hypothetical protein